MIINRLPNFIESHLNQTKGTNEILNFERQGAENIDYVEIFDNSSFDLVQMLFCYGVSGELVNH